MAFGANTGTYFYSIDRPLFYNYKEKFMNYQLNSLAATYKLARLIAEMIVPNFVITLNGDLGAGKTTLVREILYSLGVNGGIKSPTFTYVEPYKIDNIDIYHFDLYRFTSPEEWFDMGFDEYFIHPHLCFIEWAGNAGGLIPSIDWDITMQVINEIHNCQIVAYTKKGHECLKNLMENGANLYS
ncbi:MAG: tRNA ((37)-N6)-threonylcarbamoyltransferase complex ATPase subunit type 1 TsaE [Burkholderiales bacterium]|jgi:tRNA threonylcarbamoyladenosine biosynthesis protein TsaE|nr:tRNA ((37)-N6)-threonylcarbamoyltransferase complex ATPase subunit type 1 TsaE [Burkholderiales bacterium]